MAASNNIDEDMDDLFDYDVDIGELDISVPEPPPLPVVTPGKKDDDILGLDKEVRVRRKRVTVKLDEQRLLSINGLPKLRKEAPKKLKFKGKGHEYQDATRLLSYYQLWADDLFKKAKFRDTLQIIEKLGHTRTVRNAREDWIREAIGEKRDKSDMKDLHDRDATAAGEKGKEKAADAESDDDELYAPPPPKRRDAPADPTALFLGGAPDSDDDEMEMDNFDEAELEEIRLEAEGRKASRSQDKGKAPAAAPTEEEVEAWEALESSEQAKAPPARDEFEDDLAALEAIEAMEAYEEAESGETGEAKSKPAPAEDDFEDEWEAMEAMGAFDG
ncbi:replication fork protection component Swi3-domain-containing protein [Sphaerosporella brunnea]|uniref:Chromosome segregation in meiosis protein n=1 Tax=Sphaerosporella brunnea TaxID=1250544 RepID=A0A5J5EUA2_9PEZI|nr:replication fork protection component Swi3-domain-containing protein [Sphaerosporella brunnea]